MDVDEQGALEEDWWQGLDLADSDPESSSDESEFEESDDGLEHAASNSDPEEIIVDRTFRLPQLLLLPLVPEEEDTEGVEKGRRRHDRHKICSKVTRGDDDQSFNRRTYAFRKYLRTLNTTEEITEELFDVGFIPEIIIGMMMKHRRICYFGQWLKNGKRETYPLESCVVKRRFPNLVIDFHQQMILNKNRYEKI